MVTSATGIKQICGQTQLIPGKHEAQWWGSSLLWGTREWPKIQMWVLVSVVNIWNGEPWLIQQSV